MLNSGLSRHFRDGWQLCIVLGGHVAYVKVSMILEEPITSQFSQPNSLHAKLLDLGTHPSKNLS